MDFFTAYMLFVLAVTTLGITAAGVSCVYAAFWMVEEEIQKNSERFKS